MPTCARSSRKIILPAVAVTLALTAGCDSSDEVEEHDDHGAFDVLEGGYESAGLEDDGDDGDDVEARTFAASTKIWRTLSIPVCWENMPADQATPRSWVKSQIEATWESASYVDFTGWGACLPDSKGIRINVFDAGAEVFAFGRGLDGMVGGMTLNFTFNDWSPGCKDTLEQCIRASATHEFGHALGFAHEQNRADTPAACLATDPPQGENGDVTLGAWDLNSVMNYCNPALWSAKVLSPTDIEGVRQFYGSPAYASLRRDAVDLGNGTVLFFNGSKFVRYSKLHDRLFNGSPSTMQGNIAGWPASFTYVDAAVKIDGKVYLFNQANYIRYDIATNTIDQQPKPIIGNWNSWPASGWSSIDAAVNWGNGKIYIFKGSQYIRFDIATNKVDQGARSISVGWPGLYTSGIEYVLNYGSKAYFFKGRQYVRVDVAAGGTVDPGYPLNIVGNWPGVAF